MRAYCISSWSLLIFLLCKLLLKFQRLSKKIFQPCDGHLWNHLGFVNNFMCSLVREDSMLMTGNQRDITNHLFRNLICLRAAELEERETDPILRVVWRTSFKAFINTLSSQMWRNLSSCQTHNDSNNATSIFSIMLDSAYTKKALKSLNNLTLFINQQNIVVKTPIKIKL